MSIFNIVVLTWRDEARPQADQVAKDLMEALYAHVDALPGITTYRCGADAPLIGAGDFAIISRFADREAFDGYRLHAEHGRIVKELIEPNVGNRSILQWEDEPS